MQGADWEDWLDRSLPNATQPFTQGSGRRVADGASQPEPVLPWDESDSLLEPVERRVGRHGVPEVVS